MVGVALIAGSLLLPWYGIPVPGDLVQTGLGAFSWAEAALLLTAAATLLLALQVGGGYVPPRPLTEWALLLAAGVWAAAIVAYRMFERPELDFEVIVDVNRTYDLRYGIFVALAGAVLIVAAGLRARRAAGRQSSGANPPRPRRRPRRAAAARSPGAASRPRSPRSPSPAPRTRA